MSIKVSDFDYQYFIKQQFMINFVMGVLGFGLVFGLSNKHQLKSKHVFITKTL